MPVACCVVGCTNRKVKGQILAMHRVPSIQDEDRREKWITAINRKNWVPKSHHRVCGFHFITGRANEDPNHPDWIPSLNLGYENGKIATPKSKTDRFERLKERHSRKENQENEKPAESHMTDPCTPLSEVFRDNYSQTDQPQHSVHDTCLRKIADLQVREESYLKEILRLQEENFQLKEALKEVRFNDDFLSHGDSNFRTQFFTGLPSHQCFLWLVTFCSCILPKSKILSPGSVLLVILMKIKMNLVNQDLGYRFSVSCTHVRDILSTGIPSVASKISFLIHWPDKESVLRSLPAVFRNCYKFKRCRTIIDCSEVYIERPGNLTVRAATYSNYKSNNTIKFLVGISPTGGITFLSRAYGGRVSDKVITLRSGFLDMLEHNDTVLADRGFLIQEELATRGCTLAIPAFTRGKKQLSQREVEETRQLAHVRIHVERAIQRIKTFKILSTTMQMSLVPHANSIITICGALCNLQKKLVK